MTSVFADLRAAAYKYQFDVTLLVATLVGGKPTDDKVAEGWLKSKLTDTDSRIQEMVAEIMVEQAAAGTPVTKEEATKIADERKHLNGFRRQRCEDCPPNHLCGGKHQLFIEGRHVKAMIKEAASITVAAGRIKAKGWGETRKNLLNYLSEHVFVPEDRIPLFMTSGDQVTEPTGIIQGFVSTWRGTGIKYEEYVDNAEVRFRVWSDHDFSREDWGQIWVSGEMNGLGASRSQGYGRFEVTRWDAVTPARRTRTK